MRILSLILVIVFISLPLRTFATCTITSGTSNDGASVWGNTTQDTAGSFVACTGIVSSVTVLNQTNGTPVDHAVMRIQTDSGGVPTNLTLATSSEADPTGIMANTVYSFALGVPVTTGTTYWIVAGRTGARDGVNNFNWAFTAAGSNFAYADPTPFQWNTLAGRAPIFTVTIASSSATSNRGQNVILFGF